MSITDTVSWQQPGPDRTEGATKTAVSYIGSRGFPVDTSISDRSRDGLLGRQASRADRWPSPARWPATCLGRRPAAGRSGKIPMPGFPPGSSSCGNRAGSDLPESGGARLGTDAPQVAQLVGDPAEQAAPPGTDSRPRPHTTGQCRHPRPGPMRPPGPHVTRRRWACLRLSTGAYRTWDTVNTLGSIPRRQHGWCIYRPIFQLVRLCR